MQCACHIMAVLGMKWHAKACHGIPMHTKACHCMTCHAMTCRDMACHGMPWHAKACVWACCTRSKYIFCLPPQLKIAHQIVCAKSQSTLALHGMLIENLQHLSRSRLNRTIACQFSMLSWPTRHSSLEHKWVWWGRHHITKIVQPTITYTIYNYIYN